MRDLSSETHQGIRFWAPLIAVSLALFIVVVDSTMMNVAVPTIVNDLQTNVSAVQGIISSYSLIMASLMLVGGKLGAIRGVKTLLILGVVIYGVGTLIAALSWDVTVLALGWSLLEGVGAALILPLAFALLVVNYSPREQAIGFGVLGGVQASAAAVGPILGGVLTTYFSWRLGFAGEAIIALAIIPFTRYIRETVTAPEGTTLDWQGAVLSGMGLFSLVTGSILAGRYGWWEARRPFHWGTAQLNLWDLSPTPFLMLLGLTFLVGFVHWQFHQEAHHRTPLVRMRVLADFSFLTAVSANIFQSMVITGLLFVLPLYLQSAVGYSAFDSGLAILPFSITTFAVSIGSSGWGEHIPPKRLIQVGIVLMLVGTSLLYGVTSLHISIMQMVLPLGIFGVGMGLLMAHLVTLILSSVAPNDSPEASGVNNAMDQLGNSLGTAVVGSLLMTFYLSNVVDTVLRALDIQASTRQRTQIIVALEDARETITAADREQILFSLPRNLQQSLDQIVDASIITAMEDTLLVIMALLVIMFLISTFLPQPQKWESTK